MSRRRPHRLTVLFLLVLGAAAFGAGVAWALPPFTTAPKSAPTGPGQAELYQVTAGCHASYDRLVLRFRFARPGYQVRYVSLVRHDPSDRPVTLPGTARLLVVAREARAHTAGGSALIPATITPLCPNLRQIKGAGDFEGIVRFGLGLRARKGFRVFRLTGPTRIVIDVAH